MSMAVMLDRITLDLTWAPLGWALTLGTRSSKMLFSFGYQYTNLSSIQRQNLEIFKSELRDLERKLRDCQQQAVEASQALTRHERETKNLRLTMQRAEDVVGRLQDALEEDRIEEGRLEALKDHLKEAQEDLTTQQGSFEDCVISRDKANEVLRISREQIAAIDVRINEAATKVKKAEDRTLNCSKQRHTDLQEKNAAINAVKDAQDLLTRAERDREELVDIVTDHAAQAEQISARVVVPPGETADSLDAKLRKLDSDFKKGLAR